MSWKNTSKNIHCILVYLEDGEQPGQCVVIDWTLAKGQIISATDNNTMPCVRRSRFIFTFWCPHHVGIEGNEDLRPVSYTHLDVYKRQIYNRAGRL